MNTNEESDFNPDQFVQDSIDGQMSTKYELLPVGEYDGARIKEIGKARMIKPGDSSKPPFAAVDIIFTVDVSDEVREQLGRNGDVTVKYGLMLDLDPATGRLDTRKGKNVRLGRLRELAGQNGPGAWSFGMLTGAGPFKIKVDHEADKRDVEANVAVDERRVYERVTGVTKSG